MFRKLAFEIGRFSRNCSSAPSTSTLNEVQNCLQPAICPLLDYNEKAALSECYYASSQLSDVLGDDEGSKDYVKEAVDVLPKEMTRREVYMHDEEVKQARSMGIGVSNQRIEAQIMSALQRRSSLRTSLSDLNVSLFNMHSTRFAERLLAKNVGSLCLVEASQNNARTVKDFAKRVRKVDGRRIAAYCANFETLFPAVTRKTKTPLPAKLLFGDKSLVKDAVNPLTLKKERDYEDESGENPGSAPVIVGILPSPNQQTAMLDSMVYSLIRHLCHLDEETVFRYGAVHLITYLSASNYAFALCSVDGRLRFLSNTQKHQSWLFNRLFEVHVLGKGFPRGAFSPRIPLQKPIAHEKKLAEVGIENGLLYGVTIQPRRTLRIGSLQLLSNIHEDVAEGSSGFMESSRSLIPYAFWLSFTGKWTSKTNVSGKLRNYFPESFSAVSSLIGSSTKVADLEMKDFDDLFCAVYGEINEKSAVAEEFGQFLRRFKPLSTEAVFVD